MELGLDGRSAIVTGASRGIGRATARTLAGEGARLLLVARGADALDEVVEEISRDGGTAVAVAADLTEPTAAAVVVQRCMEAFGRLDVLVNNAGGARPKALAELTHQDWHEAMELNLFSAARLSVAAAGPMREAGWGRLVHIGSTNGTRPDPLFAPYSAAKAALANLSVTLSVELSPHGVLSNCIVAGITETELVRDNAAATAERTGRSIEEVMARTLARTAPPTGRLGTTEEVASAVAYLASEQAAWISGATFAVDGGTLRAL